MTLRVLKQVSIRQSIFLGVSGHVNQVPDVNKMVTSSD